MSAFHPEKLIAITAPTGYAVPEKVPYGKYIPVTPKEIAEETIRCWKAGCAMVHVHTRDLKTGHPSADVALFNETYHRIRDAGCDIIIHSTTGIGALQDPVTKKWYMANDEQRMALLDTDPRPEQISCPFGTLDFYYPDGSTYPYFNTPEFLRRFIPAIVQRKIGLAFEILDAGHLFRAKQLADEGVFDPNMNLWIEYCTNVGGIGTSIRALQYLVEEGRDFFPKAKWRASGRGKDFYPIMMMSMMMGCQLVRLGYEAFPYLPDGTLATSNVPLVERGIRIAQDLGREIATVAEARVMLGLAPSEDVMRSFKAGRPQAAAAVAG